MASVVSMMTITLSVERSNVKREARNSVELQPKLRNFTLSKAVEICKAAEDAESPWRTMYLAPPAAGSVHTLPKSRSHPLAKGGG